MRHVHHIAQTVDRSMILGGYTDPADFSNYRHVRYLNALGELTEILEVQFDSPPDYKTTIEWVIQNRDIIPVVNINFLAIHYGNERGTLPWEAQTVGDRDQNAMEKSWLSQDDLVRMKEAMETIYEIIAGSNS